MRRARKITLWVLGSLLGLLVILFLVVSYLLTAQRLTPMVNHYASQYLKATVHFDRVDVSLWRDFPLVSLSVVGGEVVSHAIGGSDTLMRFESFDVSLDAMELVSGRVDVRSVAVRSPSVDLLVDTLGRASWEIYSASDDTTSAPPLQINIDSVAIVGAGHVRFVDMRNGSRVEANFSRVTAYLNDKARYGIDIDLEVVEAKYDSVDYGRYLPLSVRGRVDVDVDSLRVGARGLSVCLAEACVVVEGDVEVDAERVECALSVGCSALGLQQALRFVPAVDGVVDVDSIRGDLAFAFDVKVSGQYAKGGEVLPNVVLDIRSNGGSASVLRDGTGIERMKVDASLNLDFVNGDNSYLDIRELVVEGSSFSLATQGRVSDLFGDMHIVADARCSARLDRVARVLKVDNLKASGVVEGVVKVDALRSQMTMARMGLAKLSADVSLKGVNVETGSLKAYLTGQVVATTNNELFSLHTSFDTINLNDKSYRSRIAGRKLKFNASVLAQQRMRRVNARAIYPFEGTFSANRLTFTVEDSIRIRLREFTASYHIKPSPMDCTIPVMGLVVDSRAIVAISALERLSLQRAKVSAAITMISPKREQEAIARRLDSLQKVYPDVARGELAAHNRKVNPRRQTKDDLAALDFDLNAGRDIRALLRRWRVEGEVKARSLRWTTPYLPLPTRLRDMDVRFNTDSLVVRSLTGSVGMSSLDVKGEVTNIRRALSGRGVLKVDFDLYSDTLNLTEIIRAINSGEAVAQQIATSDLDNRTDEQVEAMVTSLADTSNASMLVVVPKNLDVDVKMRVGYLIYNDMLMDSLSAELTSRNRKLQIKGLTADSPIGKVMLNALYSTPNKENLSLGVDVEMTGVKIDKLIDQMPQLDTLLPMLVSFEGVVDVKMAARMNVDTMMNVIIPSLSAATSIRGHNLVLLDGETFAEISKMLSFKNRKRNMVDSLSVELVIADSRVEIYPFVLQIDRYKAAVSGTHRLDMNFDYHISVLKSIVPFRLGIDIKGNLDDWKFNIVKARYKNENLPSHTIAIDSARINLRHEIISVFDNLTKK